MPSHHGRGWRIAVRLLAPAAALIGLAATGTPAHAQPSATDLRKQISAKSTQLERVVESYNKLDSQLKTARSRVAELERDLGPLQQRADAAHRNVAAIAVTAYQTGRLDSWNALLAGGGRDATLARLKTLDQLATDQQEQVTAAHDAAADQFRTKGELDQQIKDLTSRAAAIATQRKGIEAELRKLQQLRRQAGLSDERGSSYTGSVPKVSGKAGVAVAFAYRALGKPYVWAADGPNGYDCSGLTLAAWRAAGVSLYHQAATQWREVTHIKRSQLAPGDLVFYSGLGHVAIFVGNGKVIHAPTFGEVVKIASVDMMTPYGYGRVRT
ncbi:NlpC/P60 family protein [Catellatospora sp. KI3]|uniref:C40 family peptidase n=1 Tax=Catellatospora sp. KI3 TaxID=3041620 RepID=UPI00248296C1|nr:C40 family peptidase [Catellatospora sp. KI3]MDI1464383.1 NlpC/P60 family protein [Catellatospora sp. KI3]